MQPGPAMAEESVPQETICGGVASAMTTSKPHEPGLPQASVAEQVTCVGPAGNVALPLREQTTGSGRRSDVLSMWSCATSRM